MLKKIIKLTEEQFDEKYELLTNHFERAKQPISVADEDVCSFNGKMFETFGEELEFVREMSKQNRVITIIESDENCSGSEDDDVECIPDLYYISGMRLVNRIGFFVTTEPITEEFELKIEW
jgi:hypothetical protein